MAGLNAGWPIEIIPLGSVSMGTAVWTLALSRRHITIVVATTFAYNDKGELSLVKPAPLGREYGAAPIPRVHASSDLAPYLRKCDVWLRGHAYGSGEPNVSARMTLARRDDAALLDKTLHVYGDRDGGKPAPFDRMPISWERAAKTDDNPGGAAIANVYAPDDHTVAACFDLVAPQRPSRRALLSLDPDALNTAELDIPKSFDWRYFQAAPVDQQCAFLLGGEWLILDGLHPSEARIRLRLPAANGEIRVLGIDEEARALDTWCDGLAIDTDNQRITLRWRGCFQVPDGQPLGELRAIGGVALPHTPIDWTLAGDLLRDPLSESVDEAQPVAPDSANTAVSDDDDEHSAARAARAIALSQTSADDLRRELGIPVPDRAPQERAGAAVVMAGGSSANALRERLLGIKDAGVTQVGGTALRPADVSGAPWHDQAAHRPPNESHDVPDSNEGQFEPSQTVPPPPLDDTV